VLSLVNGFAKFKVPACTSHPEEIHFNINSQLKIKPLEDTHWKLYLAAKPCLRDVILSNLKLAGSRKTCN